MILEGGRAMNAKITENDRDPIDEAGLESFPASDPPAWTSLRAGLPVDKVPATGISPRFALKTNPPVHADKVDKVDADRRAIGIVIGVFLLGLATYLSIFFWFLFSYF